MKKTINVITTLLLILGLICGNAATSFAATSVTEAKAAYIKSLKKQSEAKSHYDKANASFKTGAYGFYQWIADNYTGWQKKDAEDALLILTTSSFKDYTKKGNKDDATSLDNVKVAVDLFPTLASKRAGDKNHPNLQPPTIRNAYMARAQVQANISAYTIKHEFPDNGCDLHAGASECLAWGYNDPFEGWYDKELRNYNQVRSYTLKKYGQDINTAEWNEYTYRDDFDFNASLKEIEQFGEIGHYESVCRGIETIEHLYPDNSVDAYQTLADKAFFGLAFSGYGYCHSLETGTDTYTDGYTVSEYTSLFNNYYNKVSPKTEKAAYNKAKKAASSALKTLKRVTRPKKPTAKRSSKKIIIRWKKTKGVKGYQISVSPTKSKVKIVATVKANATKKTVKIANARKQYVKIRSYVVVKGKKIYSNWSAVRRSN